MNPKFLDYWYVFVLSFLNEIFDSDNVLLNIYIILSTAMCIDCWLIENFEIKGDIVEQYRKHKHYYTIFKPTWNEISANPTPPNPNREQKETEKMERKA